MNASAHRFFASGWFRALLSKRPPGGFRKRPYERYIAAVLSIPDVQKPTKTRSKSEPQMEFTLTQSLK